MYQSVTHEISVSVKPVYLEDQSSPDEGRFFWAYHVRIENMGADTVQLRSRHWRITDAMGRTQEVRSAGVGGEQPILEPGEHFEYASGTPLPTPLPTPPGIMVGSYQMQTATGEMIEIEIPEFSLDSPHQTVRLQ